MLECIFYGYVIVGVSFLAALIVRYSQLPPVG